MGCLDQIDKEHCTDLQRLDIEGAGLAQKYVCSEEGLKRKCPV